MNASNYLEAAILNHFFKNQVQTPSAKVYVALYISDPTDADTGTEITGGGYVRQEITFTNPAQENGKATISNSVEIRFPVATTNWGTVSHFGIRTAATGGNLLAHAAVPIPKLIESGDEAKYNVGSLTITMD